MTKRKLAKITSLILIIAMVMSVVPIGISGTKTEIKASVQGIRNGATYKIVSAYNGKAITQTDVSNYYANCVVWNTDAMSDLARWKVEESGDYYTITNVVTNKSMKTTGNNSGDTLDLNGNDGAYRYKWKLVPITSGKYEGCFFIVSAVKNDNGEEEYAEIISDDDKRDKDGAQVRLWTKVTSIDYEPRQIWKFERSDAEYAGFTEEMSDKMLEAYAKQYYVDNVDTGGKTLHTDDKDWGMAEELEALLDGYETTGKGIYKTMFCSVFDDFLAYSAEYNGGGYAQKRNGSARYGGEDWTKNPANDDIAWYVLAAVRAYILFGEQKYLTVAKYNFDEMYERASSEPNNNGMLIWNMSRDHGSLSCINGPATVAACYLGIATGDESYYEKAKKVYTAWRNSGVYITEGKEIGHVRDGGYDGGYPCTTYNQATFIGAATMLYEHYGDEIYYKDACDAVKHTLKEVENEETVLSNGQRFRDGFCYNNILVREALQDGQEALVGDMGKFRGILMRYLRKFIVDFNKGEYLDFFKDNAKIAWMNRNSKGLQWCEWNKKTPENGGWQDVSYVSANAVSLVANMPTYADKLERDAYSTIEAEDMDYTHGLISENSSGTSGGRSLGGVKDGCYTAYYNIDFGDIGASRLKLRYSRKTEDNTSGTVEVRLGGTNGTLIAKATLENTGTWNDWKEITVDTARVTGLQNIYVIFKSSTEYVCNFDYFTFEQADTSNQGYMLIMCESNTRYAQLKNGTIDNTVLARSTSRGDWEQFQIVINDDQTISLKSPITGKYVRAAYGSNGFYITANGDSINNESKFVIEKLSDDTTNMQVSIKSVHTGKYLMVDANDSEYYILANSETVTGAAETFHFVTANGETILPEGVILKGDYVTTSSSIKIEGMQISTTLGGSRVVASVEPKINGKSVKSWGLIYGLKSACGINYDITDDDLLVGNQNNYVKALESTPLGTLDGKMGESDTAIYYVQTMLFGVYTSDEFNADYKVRAYALLEDGSYVYSENITDYSIFSVTKYLYDNCIMNTFTGHEYLYNTILKTVDNNYAKVEYNWSNSIITP